MVDLDGEAAVKVASEIDGRVRQAGLSDSRVLDALDVQADVVVDNAGVQYVAPVEEFPPERFAMVLRLMLEAPFRIVRAALPGM